MRRPLTALLIAPDPEMWAAVDAGVKRISVREGHRDYRQDERVVLCCHLTNRAVMATIREVRHTRLKTVTLAELTDDGFEDRFDFERTMFEFYPNMDRCSDVTVIRWEYDPK